MEQEFLHGCWSGLKIPDIEKLPFRVETFMSDHEKLVFVYRKEKGRQVMFAWISILVPPLIFVYLREKFGKKYANLQEKIVGYAVSVMLINMLMLFILIGIFKFQDSITDGLNNYGGFTLKYMFLATIIAVSIPLCEKVLKEKVRFKFMKPRFPQIKLRHVKVIAWVYAVLLFLMNFIRIFDNNFWGDEAFTANLVQRPVPELIASTAGDVHPPLYYLLVKVLYELCGNQGWVFHLASLIPCGIMVFFAMTVIWKKVSKEAALILVTMLCLSHNAVIYNVEVRMYSWGAFFVFFSFYELYQILQKEKNLNYFLFVIFSLGAAYTHYYCLISVAFFYVFLFLLAFFIKRVSMIKIMISGILTICGYLPWFWCMLGTFLNHSESYWLDSFPTFMESISYLFSEQIGSVILFLFGVIIVVALAYESRILEINRNTQGCLEISILTKTASCSNIFLWIIAGILSVLGTILFGIVISAVVRPFYVPRYIYPVSVIAWTVLGISLSRLKARKIYTGLILLIMLVTFVPSYYTTYTKEKSRNAVLQETLAVTVSKIALVDIILTNSGDIEWNVAKYYYPDNTTQLVDMTKLNDLEEGMRYWLAVTDIDDMGSVYESLKRQGFSCEQVVENGILGDVEVEIYRVDYIGSATITQD